MGKGLPFDEKYTVDPATGCWVWTGYRDRNGYGRHKVEWAHRWAYERFVGPIPERYEVDHTCSNPPCVNPSHLDAVTKVEHARRTFQRLGKDDLHLQAVALKVSGLTYDEIAEALGYSGKGSASSAVQAAITKGLVAAGDIPRRRLLDEDDYRDIRAIHAMGVPQTEIGRWYGVDSSRISRICSMEAASA